MIEAKVTGEKVELLLDGTHRTIISDLLKIIYGIVSSVPAIKLFFIEVIDNGELKKFLLDNSDVSEKVIVDLSNISDKK